jgi:dinuclear metal center YbgI/SA1388 family protein
MVKRNDIVNFLNKELNIKKIKDSSKNGLQVNSCKEVKKIAFAVDACMETFEKAKKEKCDLIVVHHGLFWKGKQLYKNQTKKRVRFLKKNKISLYAAHLPLDLNSKYGNNISLAKILNLKRIKPFGEYKKVIIGYKGEFGKKIRLNELEKKLNKELKTECKAYKFSDKKIKTIGIISGGGGSEFKDAVEQKLDCFLTGEEYHSIYHHAKEGKINLIFAGHYATETVGVKALMPVLGEKFGVKTVFIDSPTKL